MMAKVFLRTKKWILVAAVSISACVMSGCIESSFNLATESKLPQGVTIPSGVTRADVTVTLDFYTGGLANFTVRDRTGKKLTTVVGRTKGNPIYLKTTPKGPDPTSPSYELVVINGVTEILECRPYEANENMEQNGEIVALFYVIDDPAIRKEFLAGSGVQ